MSWSCSLPRMDEFTQSVYTLAQFRSLAWTSLSYRKLRLEFTRLKMHEEEDKFSVKSPQLTSKKSEVFNMRHGRAAAPSLEYVNGKEIGSPVAWFFSTRTKGMLLWNTLIKYVCFALTELVEPDSWPCFFQQIRIFRTILLFNHRLRLYLAVFSICFHQNYFTIRPEILQQPCQRVRKTRFTFRMEDTLGSLTCS